MSPEAIPTPVEPIADDIPEMIRRAQAAFRRDLPELLKDRRLRGKWVAYHGDRRVGLGQSEAKLCKQCLQDGIPDEQLFIRLIQPYGPAEAQWEIASPSV
jgi:hypothetical protein